MPFFRVNRYVVDQSLEVLLIGINAYIFLRNRHTKTSTRNQIFRVFGNERSAVQSGYIRNFQNFYRFKGCEVYSGNTGVVVSIDKQPASVKLAIGLREFNVVGIVPRHFAVGSVEHRFGFFAVAVAVLRILRKYRNFLEQTA